MPNSGFCEKGMFLLFSHHPHPLILLRVVCEKSLRNIFLLTSVIQKAKQMLILRKYSNWQEKSCFKD